MEQQRRSVLYSSLKAPEGAAAEDPSAWAAAVEQAKVHLEASTFKAINLELAAKYSTEAWKSHVADLEKLAAAKKKEAEEDAARAEQIQVARQAAQQPQIPRLTAADRKYREAVETNTQVAQACSYAEAEVQRLKRLAQQHGLLAEEVAGQGGAAAAGQ